MTSKDIVLKVHYDMGKADAAALRAKACAGEITDTEIIDSEQAIPEYNPKADYSRCATDTPVRCGVQVYGLVQPHNAANHPDTAPGTIGGATLWRVKHTTNPKKAKPWVQPDAVNLYKVGECMVWTDGTVRRALRDTNFSPEEYAADWEEVAV